MYVNVLGASAARQCLEAALLDEVRLCLAPVTLGDGVRLFDYPGGSCARLERLSLSQTGSPPTSGCASSAEARPASRRQVIVHWRSLSLIYGLGPGRGFSRRRRMLPYWW
jgi:dihydrofolate reductase